MKYLKNIIKTILILIVATIISINIYNYINIKILKKDLSTIFGYATLEVISGSMEPTIKIGEIILIDTNEKEYKKGDIVTFYDTTGTFVTHRIADINKKEMITKGDNNQSKDDPTNVKKIVGKYKFTIPYLGAVLSILKKPLLPILILIIGILYCYLISSEETKEKVKEVTSKIIPNKPRTQKSKNSSKNKKKKKRKKRKKKRRK